MPGPVSKTKVVKAVAVSAQQINEQIRKIKRAKAHKRAAEQTRVRRLAAKATAARKARLHEQQRIKKLKAEQLQLKKQHTIEAKQLKALKEKRSEVLKSEQKALQDKLLKQQLSSEQNRLAKTQSSQLRGLVDRYKVQILQQIGQYWIVPGSANKDLSCIYLIELAPGGVVINVKLLRSSGNSALDRSARVAIYKASPLPVPKDDALFGNFRAVRLTVSPKTVVSQ